MKLGDIINALHFHGMVPTWERNRGDTAKVAIFAAKQQGVWIEFDQERGQASAMTWERIWPVRDTLRLLVQDFNEAIRAEQYRARRP
jgi:hypothetical protein